MLGMELLITEIQTLEGIIEETRKALIDHRSQLIDGGFKEDSVTIEDNDTLVKDEFEINLKYSFLASKLAHSIPLFFELAIANKSLVDKFSIRQTKRNVG